MQNEAELGHWIFPRESTYEERFVASCAFEVYNEYVRNLSVDYQPYALGMSTVPLSVHQTHVIGPDVAVMFMDLKICKALQFVTSTELEEEEIARESVLPHLVSRH